MPHRPHNPSIVIFQCFSCNFFPVSILLKCTSVDISTAQQSITDCYRIFLVLYDTWHDCQNLKFPGIQKCWFCFLFFPVYTCILNYLYNQYCLYTTCLLSGGMGIKIQKPFFQFIGNESYYFGFFQPFLKKNNIIISCRSESSKYKLGRLDISIIYTVTIKTMDWR